MPNPAADIDEPGVEAGFDGDAAEVARPIIHPLVMPGLVPGLHVFAVVRQGRRGWPGQVSPAMTELNYG